MCCFADIVLNNRFLSHCGMLKVIPVISPLIGPDLCRKISRFLLGLAALVLITQSFATAQGICDRTSQVRDKLLEITGVSECADVTSTHLEAVTDLNLTGTGITALEAGDFSGLTNLNELELSENALTTLPEGVFSGLTNLQYLWLDDNSLSTLSVDIFSGLTNLKWLELFDNSLTSLPVGIFSGLSSLTDLSLEENSLTSLPVEIFSGLNTLTDLNLDSNPLSALPEDIFSGLGEMDWLNLHHTSLTSVPKGIFSGLSKLRILNLHNNSLTSLPEDIFSGKGNLKTLALNNNSLTTLSEGLFSGLSKLRLLSLSNNSLGELPEKIFSGLSGLEILRLANISVTTLPDDLFSELTKLRYLFLNNNDLTQLPENIFNGLNSLETLRLAGNSLEVLPSGIFDDILDTLDDRIPNFSGLSLDSRLKATLSFASTSQIASEGTTVRVSATLSRTLPVAVRVPFTIGGSASDGDYEGLSPAADSGLLFLAGETSKEITFTLSQNNDNQEETLVLTLAQLAGIGLRQSDGAGSDAPHLKTEHFLNRSAAVSTHTVTISAPSGGICDRTTQVRDKLLELTGVAGCGNVTSTHLEGVMNLYLSHSSISSVKAGDFSGLTQLKNLKLDNNSLASLPEGIFSGLSSLQELDLRSNSLSSLPSGIFDDILDTLGAGPGVNGLSVDSSLKATLSFASTAQTVSEGTAVQVSATLSRTLPVAVRVPFTIGGSAADDDYEGLSPAADSGLLFLAGETSKEITFTLSENNDNQEETLVLTLAQLSGIGLRRSDGSGSDAPHLKTESVVSRSATSSTHTVTIPKASGGICDRTTQVRDKLLELTGVSGCANVTSTHLEGVTSLDLSHSSISALKAGDFGGLIQLTRLKLDNNSLTGLPAGIFSGLSRLQELDLRSNSLSSLPAGIFDDILDTLGAGPSVNGLSVDSSLKATLSFASTAQTVSEGTAVQVSATLSRVLPVAVRVPFTIGGSATDDDYEGLSPAADSGLLFLAGETSKEITFTLSENNDNQEETLVLTLAQLSGIGLRRSDGSRERCSPPEDRKCSESFSHKFHTHGHHSQGFRGHLRPHFPGAGQAAGADRRLGMRERHLDPSGGSDKPGPFVFLHQCPSGRGLRRTDPTDTSEAGQ